MLLSRGPLLGGTALRRLPSGPQLVVSSYLRSFSTSHVTRLPSSFFHSHRALKLDPLASAKVASTSQRTKWTYARHGLLTPNFSANYPWLAGIVRLCLSVVVGSTILIGIVLIHDASTYTKKHLDRVPVNPLALAPRRGGPKNLPIIDVNIDDLESEEKTKCKGKPRLVILGGGWGVRLFSLA